MAASGGFWSAAGQALEIEAGLLLIHLQLQHQLFWLALRALAPPPPPSHPLHVRNAAACCRLSPVSHHSPLDLALTLPSPPPDPVVETIHSDPIPLWSPHPAPPVNLAQGKEIGTHKHEQTVRDLPLGLLLVHTNGSMDDGGAVSAGVAAKLWDGGKVKEEVKVKRWQRDRKGMGQHQTVYTCKLEGLRLALYTLLVTQTADLPLAALISLDVTSALTHSTDLALSSGQHLRLAIRHIFEVLKRTRKDLDVHLSWSPGHVMRRSRQRRRCGRRRRQRGHGTSTWSSRRAWSSRRTWRVASHSCQPWQSSRASRRASFDSAQVLCGPLPPTRHPALPTTHRHIRPEQALQTI